MVPFCDLPALPQSSDAWLSGFRDAERTFTVSFLKGTSTYRIRMIVPQKGEENLPLLSQLILIFQAGHIEKHSKPHNFQYVISASRNCVKVKSYFEKFALHTKKATSYKLWCEILDHIKAKDHLNFEILPMLIEKRKEINKKNKQKQK